MAAERDDKPECLSDAACLRIMAASVADVGMPDTADQLRAIAERMERAAPSAGAAINQCDGCARGLPVRSRDFGREIHYDNESGQSVMACSKDRYAHSATALWISTNERLPEDETPVLIVWNGQTRIGEIRWDHPGHEETYVAFRYWDDPTDDGQAWDWREVTHWMPLPSAPTDSGAKV